MLKKNYDSEIQKALFSSDESMLLQYFKQDMEMSEIEFYNFCKRYSQHDCSTVADFFREMYGRYVSLEKLHKALQDAVDNFPIEIII